MTKASSPLIVALTLLASLGCAERRESIVRCDILLPNAAAEEVDKSVAVPMANGIYGGLGEVRTVTAIATQGHATIYAVSDPDIQPPKFFKTVQDRVNVSTRALPAAASRPTLEALPKGAAVPNDPAGTIDQVRVTLDRVKLADAGLTAEDIVAVLRERPPTTQPTAQTVDELSSTPIRTNAAGLPGGVIHLGDVANVQLVQAPDRIVRHFP